ncbi:MAG: C1 family peptidase [Candidatus Wallbacteria bacterium]|nr:C1 family peptidase [Candidatus Wallbacteria bacterium]
MKVCILLSVILFSLFLNVPTASAEDLVGLLQNLAITAQQEGSLYQVSTNAAPNGIPLDKLCGLKRPDYWDAVVHMRKAPVGKATLPAQYDWRAQNGCTPIKNQGSCGSCWSFASVGIFESAILIKDSDVVDLAEQDLLDCNSYGYSCNGGWLDAVGYFKDKGCSLEKLVPYQAADGTCKNVSRTYKIKDWATVDATTDAIKQAIYKYGPVSSVVAADSSFQYYTSGVYNHSYSSVNHAIILVGWDDSMGKKGCWILRNSWGTSWGEKGYMYIEYGCSKVGSDNVCVTY